MNDGLGFYDGLAVVSYGLIAASYLMRDMKWLRLITVLACSVDLVVYYFIRPGNPLWVQWGMSLLFIAINLLQLGRLWRESRTSHLDSETLWLYQHVFQTLSPGEFRRILQLGQWLQVSARQRLMTQGNAVTALGCVVNGHLLARQGRTVLNAIAAGGMVGEISYLTGRKASADVVSSADTRLFGLSHAALDTLKSERPELHTKLLGLMGQEVARKLAASHGWAGAGQTA